MDLTPSLRFPKNENHLGFKVENGLDHILHCPKNEIHLHSFYKKLNAANFEAYETHKL